ncbi:bifunctional 3-(3-hydroxy-phenyl)propionate/3-hydroxycinnamic acid hydroxylase MhpA [Goodfellowiella coeruleoviolacea]|uniref:3-(3-hydroxy-phenyl)propionate hydroxylase n=1 Tax=Goodfellowiella coeruleoviolacea TaxID=334858 RepID=A0AAE3KHT0_9PSEU|nr:bifunctional 3-(3-hydroxy-phenyl)propionate/3-hydroxycinnamic acid hydroxylase [Goodfellowiella coeruleoviolacea]MCP2167182.1 3-(3-hydroxy-phenyl)propionate hydroxylase [Goodfellowiella coeruleoviolacea]
MPGGGQRLSGTVDLLGLRDLLDLRAPDRCGTLVPEQPRHRGPARAGRQSPSGGPVSDAVVSEVVPVLVVGAGPTGLTAATLLARRGIRCLLVERHTDVYPMPRAVHLDDEVLRILQQLGVAEEFTALSRPTRGLRLVDRRLRTIAEFRRDRVGAHGWPEANLFDQPDLERLLRANLRRHGGVELRGGTAVERVEPVSGGPAPVRVLLRRADSAGDPATAGGVSTVVWAHAVLGCDGANSLTRTAVGTALRDLGFTEHWLVVDVRCGRDWSGWDGIHQVCDSRRPTTFLRLGPYRYRWEFRLGTGVDPAEVSVRRLLAPWTRGIPEDDLRVLRRADYPVRARVAERWRRGRVFLLGDAAHLTPPFVGQGLGAGLRDAANLAWKLAAVLRNGADEALLDTYQAEREPHVTRAIRTAVLVGRAMTGGQDRAAALRRLLLTRALRVPGLAAVAARRTACRLPAGVLVRPRRRSGADLAGTLCPQPWVRTGHGQRRLDDLLGTAFAVLSAGPLDATATRLARRLGARVVLVRPDRTRPSTVDGAAVVTSDVLVDWLRRGRAGWVLLRPDRVVLTSAPPAGARPGHHHRAEHDVADWLPLLTRADTGSVTGPGGVR